MADRWAVAMAFAAAAGAWASRPLPIVLAATIAALGLCRRHPLLLCIGVALLTSSLGARAWAGLDPPGLGPFRGTAVLVNDPVLEGGAVRAEARLRGKRVEVRARGAPARAIAIRMAGETVLVAGRLLRLGEVQRWRAARHLSALLVVDDVGGWSPANAVSELANRARRVIARGAESLEPRDRALFLGFLLGDDRDQSPEVVDDFRASGLAHLLAVSGQNVAFVLAVAALFLRRLGLGGRVVVGGAVLGFFGLMTRWEPSVLRAVAMAGLTLAAIAIGRPQTTLRLLALATTALLLVDPLLLHSAGFLLSVGACIGIAVLSRPFTAAIPGPRSLAALVGVTTAAQVGIAPIAVPLFGGLPVAAIPANLLAVPTAAPIVAWGLVAGPIAGMTGGGLASLLHVPTELLVRWVAAVAEWAANLPLGDLYLGHVGVLTIALLLGLRPRWRYLAAALALLVFAVAALPHRPTPLHGDVVIAGASLWRIGDTTVLVADSPRPVPLLAALRRRDVSQLDVLVVRRASRAAARSIEPVLRRYQPRHLVVAPGSPLATTGARVAPAEVLIAGAVVRACSKGAGLAVDVVLTNQPARATRCARDRA
jgi:competence protein ComEC